jgi:DivIVA domain-containing protein
MAQQGQRFARRTDPVEEVREVEFPIVLRGYDREAVDDYVERMTRLVEELQSTQLRENVVQRALDEVGEQTSGILQRAHEAAEEIASRSRAQAEGRIQRAEREAEIVRREADGYAERLVAETRVLWEERMRLIDEMRGLADEVLATADDALDRITEPAMIRQAAAEEAAAMDTTAPVEATEPPPAPPTDQPTVEVEAQSLNGEGAERPAKPEG